MKTRARCGPVSKINKPKPWEHFITLAQTVCTPRVACLRHNERDVHQILPDRAYWMHAHAWFTRRQDASSWYANGPLVVGNQSTRALPTHLKTRDANAVKELYHNLSLTRMHTAA